MNPVSVDPTIVPWSCAGSFLSLASRAGVHGRLTPGQDIYLVSHTHYAGLPLFAIRSQVPGPLPPPNGFHKTPSPTQIKATPSRLEWTYQGECVAKVVFQDPYTLRFAGTKALSFDTDGGLDLEDWRNWIFEVPPDGKTSLPTLEFTSHPDVALRLVALKGVFEPVDEPPFGHTSRRITIKPNNNETSWELVISERPRSTPSADRADDIDAATRISFDSLDHKMSGKFNRYAQNLCPWNEVWSTTAARTDQLAAFVMWTSTVRPEGFFTREAVLMSKLWMNKVWSWDNCFNCLALAAASSDKALEQMLLPFDYMTPEGRLPDSIAYSDLLYDTTKPPIYGWTIFKLLELLPGGTDGAARGDIFDKRMSERWEEIYAKVSRFSNFWHNHRATKSSAVPWYSHGFDSGWDNATCFDSHPICVSPDMAAFLAIQDDALAVIARHLGKDEEATAWTTHSKRMVKALIDEFWDNKQGTFVFKDARTGETWTSQTLLRFIPLVASAYLPKSVVETMSRDLTSHLTEWGLATEDPSSPHYTPDGYWRGPIWAPPTILIESGLRKAGYTELADEVSQRFMRLCEVAGFAENYDAFTGTGNRDLSYTWSASTYLVLRREHQRRIGKLQ